MQGDGSDDPDRGPAYSGRTGDELVAQFASWSAAERSSGAARSRSLEKSLRHQALSTATWAGSLLDLAERRSRVSVHIGSAQLTGTLEAVGADFCVLVRPGGGPVLAPLEHVASVRVDSMRDGPGGGSRFPALELSMAAALSVLAEERWPVNLGLGDGRQVAGDLVAVGHDVVTVRQAGGPGRSTFVNIAAVRYCELR